MKVVWKTRITNMMVLISAQIFNSGRLWSNVEKPSAEQKEPMEL